VGDGEDLPLLKNFLDQHQIGYSVSNENKPVIFTSWVQNVQSVLEGLDMVVLTSFNEGTPLSLIEAQICGKPVVAVNVGGVRDTLQHGLTGFLIPDHDVTKFVEAILQLADDTELRKTMGENASTFATASFSKEKEINRMRNIYMSDKTL